LQRLDRFREHSHQKPLADASRERLSAKALQGTYGTWDGHMSRQRHVEEVESRRALAPYAGLALAIGLLGAADVTEAAGKQDAAPAHQATKRAPGAGLDDRVKVFAIALDLDTAQQSQLRRILLGQSDAVRRIWSDKSLSPAERAPATRAASERTGDEIRAILNGEQRKKYNSASPAAAPDKGDERSVEQWLDATRAR
jgi:hypothetical protein